MIILLGQQSPVVLKYKVPVKAQQQKLLALGIGHVSKLFQGIIIAAKGIIDNLIHGNHKV
jgi:hypothetical protein